MTRKNTTAGITMDGALKKGISISEGMQKKGGLIVPKQTAPKRPPPPPAQKK